MNLLLVNLVKIKFPCYLLCFVNVFKIQYYIMQCYPSSRYIGRFASNDFLNM